MMDRMNRNEKEINALTHKIIGCAIQIHRTQVIVELEETESIKTGENPN
jgi:NifU-like protein involved in Fe-S cluster formation